MCSFTAGFARSNPAHRKRTSKDVINADLSPAKRSRTFPLQRRRRLSCAQFHGGGNSVRKHGSRRRKNGTCANLAAPHRSEGQENAGNATPYLRDKKRATILGQKMMARLNIYNRPNCSITRRSASRLSGLKGAIGRRTFPAGSPSILRASLTGTGFVSIKSARTRGSVR
ncbi:MAG: hypothetical protein CSYNP_02025 [Syntrophus sp. SKADARSKE-3]|nr:hypothetical protein [Syntrophus sp. SKADARSKE-3]